MRQGGLTWAPSTNSPDPHGQVIEPSRYQLGPKAPFALLHWTLIGSLHIPTGPVWPRGSAAIVPRRQQVFRQSILRARGGGGQNSSRRVSCAPCTSGGLLGRIQGKSWCRGPYTGGVPGSFQQLGKRAKTWGSRGPARVPWAFQGENQRKGKGQDGAMRLRGGAGRGSERLGPWPPPPPSRPMHIAPVSRSLYAIGMRFPPQV